jgi:hypothetical protein
MSVSTTKPRKKKKADPAPQTYSHRTRWSRAFEDQKGILLTGVLYILAIAAESAYAGVPFDQFFRIVYVVPLILVKCLVLLLVFAAGSLVRGFFLPEARKKQFFHRLKHGWNHMDALISRYIEGDVFAYGCLGLLVMVANGFYFIQKSLIHILHPYAWDDAFIAADRFLHFGHLPDEFVVSVTQMFHLGHVLDIAYFLWFVVMYASLGFTLFWDNNLKRRLRFLWCFLLSWVILGSVMGLYFSSAGPLFYHAFFPGKPDPYTHFVTFIKDYGPSEFPLAYWGGEHLLAWTTSTEMININAVAAFPSLHLAIAWLATLYGFKIDRRLGAAGVMFCVLIYLATILSGFHYAIDGYVSLATVSLMWWGIGKLLDLRHGDAPLLKRT